MTFPYDSDEWYSDTQGISGIVFAGASIGLKLEAQNTGGNIMNAVHELPNGEAVHITELAIVHYHTNGDELAQVFLPAFECQPSTLAQIAFDYIASL